MTKLCGNFTQFQQRTDPAITSGWNVGAGGHGVVSQAPLYQLLMGAATARTERKNIPERSKGKRLASHHPFTQSVKGEEKGGSFVVGRVCSLDLIMLLPFISIGKIKF